MAKNINTTESMEAAAEAARESRYITNAEIDEIAKITGREMAKQKKVLLMIPVDPKEETYHCTINGYRYDIPRGKLVEVPEDLAKFIQRRTQAAVAAAEFGKSMENVEV